MKKIFSIIAAFLAGAMMFSCADPMEDTLELGTEISVDTEKIDFEAENNEAVTVNVTANGTWMVAAPQWLKVTPMMGEAGTTAVTITATDNMETVVKEDGSEVVEMAAPRAYDLIFAGEDASVKVSTGVDKETGEETFKYVQATATVKVSQVGDPEKAKAIPVTIAEFNAAAEDATKYQLKGVITSIANDHYGNIYIEDETASTYIYGLYMKSETGELIKYDVVTTLGLKVGDTLVVEGTRGSYKDTIEMIGALYVSHTPGEGGETPEPEPEPEVVTATISEIAEAGKYKVEGATILASYARGYLVGDATGKMLAYLGADHGLSLVAGDVVTIEGSVSEYGGFFQFVAGSTLTKTGTAEVNHGEVEVMDGAAMDAYVTAPAIKYVSYTGKLAVSGTYFNVNIEGAATAMGSLQYPIEAEAISALNGKNITVTGYAIGVSSGKYVNTMVISVEEVAGGEEPEPEPEITTSTFGAITEAGDYKVENAVVVNVTLKGYLLYDGTGYAYVYVGSKTDYVVGTKMTVIGTVSYYYDMMQIAPTTVEDVTTVEVTHPEAEEINGAAIDAYMSAPTYKYVKVTGKLSVDSFTNLIVEGTTNTVSVSYFDGDLSALNEKDVTLYGYLGGSNTSKGYATMYLVSYEEVAADEPSEGGRLYWGNDEFGAIADAVGQETLDAAALANMTATEDLTINDDGITYKGLELLLGGGKFKLKTNQSIADPEGDKENRIQFGGKGDLAKNKQLLVFEAPAAGILKIDAVSSSSSAARPLAVAVDGVELGQYTTVLQGQEATGEIFTIDCSTVTAGSKIYLYSADSGINVFSIEYTY